MNNRKKSFGLFIGLIVILAVFCLVFSKLKTNKKDKPELSETSSFSEGSSTESGIIRNTEYMDGFSETASPEKTSDTESTSEGVTASGYEYSYAGFNPQYADLNVDDRALILVNRDYILPENYKPQLVRSVTNDPNSKLLDAGVAPHYNEMYNAAAKDGIYLTTVSGYRSYSLQKTNFENKIQKYINQGYSKVKATQKAATIILPPGTSEHNAGLAMDIISLEQSFENSKEFRWLSENAADYGFILRYPKDKEAVTEIIYEPWHWRYVGVENAKKIKASGLCLEEYLGVK